MWNASSTATAFKWVAGFFWKQQVTAQAVFIGSGLFRYRHWLDLIAEGK
jgi:hypothetical protein